MKKLLFISVGALSIISNLRSMEIEKGSQIGELLTLLEKHEAERIRGIEELRRLRAEALEKGRLQDAALIANEIASYEKLHSGYEQILKKYQK